MYHTCFSHAQCKYVKVVWTLYQINLIGGRRIKYSSRTQWSKILRPRGSSARALLCSKRNIILDSAGSSARLSRRRFVFTAVCKSHGGQVISGSGEKSNFIVGTLNGRDTESRMMHLRNAAPNCTIIVRRFRESHSSTEARNHVHCCSEARFFASRMRKWSSRATLWLLRQVSV